MVDRVPQALRSYLRIVALLPSAGPRLLAGLLAVNLLLGVLPVTFAVTTSVMIGKVPAATSALDAQAEHSLFERYAEGARRVGRATGAITVLISHRFSTVRMADLILVVEGGRIIEAGDHAALLRAGGLYAELYELQARAYG